MRICVSAAVLCSWFVAASFIEADMMRAFTFTNVFGDKLLTSD